VFELFKTWFQRLLLVVAFGYSLVLIGLWLTLALFGQDWWLANAVLYLPYALCAVPLPLIAGALSLSGRARLLWTQLVAGLVLLFPLMGLRLPWPASKRTDRPALRVLSYNVLSGFGGYAALVREIEAEAPDLVVLQEVLGDGTALFSMLAERFPFVDGSTQFIVASRHPIVSELEPPPIPHEGRMRSPRFVRYLIDSPLGRLALYNVHPISPREGLAVLRGQGLKREILSGRILSGHTKGQFVSDSTLRALQVRSFAAMADRETDPVLIAGDTNLPGLSPLWRRHLSRYEDGFASAGWGFGYTFPSRLAWLRIDRIMASRALKFVDFRVGRGTLSDHRYVVADLQRRDP
jgi:vancomycin resistance protein VanJ